MFEKPKRTRSLKLLKGVKTESCVVGAFCFGPIDPAHVISRGAGGPDEEFNVMPLCRKHHQVQHKRGWPVFAALNINVWTWLLNHGWEVNGSKIEHPKSKLKIHPVGE